MPFKLAIIAILSSIFISSTTFAANDLKTGDILLQPLGCWSCSLIEQQEDSEYSHIGIYVTENDQDFVIEAFGGKVQKVTLQKFMAKTQKGLTVRVKRLKNIDLIDLDLLKSVLESFLDLPYDRYFLWDNEVNGKEAIYCSELVYKAYVYFTPFITLAPKRMLFDINPEDWDRYFRGETPRGKWGISPADFDKSHEFEFIKEL